MFKKINVSVISLVLSLTITAQTGKIIGKITDAKTGETLPGATVLIEGTTKGASADFDGNFVLNNVPIGKINLITSYISYESKKNSDVVIKDNETTLVNFELTTSASLNLNEVVVQAEVKKDNNVALVMQQKNNASVSDGVSAENIKRTPDKNTSDVLKRVSGASVQDNKFVIIRGLNDRYNAAYLNGAPLPSTESDRKAFSFDVFSSSMLDNLVIYKTARPDLPGEFAGGIIEITTKGIPDKNFVQLTVGSGFNTATKGKQQLYLDKGKKDWLGVDDGTRNIIKDMPEQTEFSQNIHQQANYAQQINTGNWEAKSKQFTPNANYLLSAGYNVKLKNKDFIGVIGSLSYNSTNNYFTTSRINYESGKANDSSDPLVIDKQILDETYQNQKLLGALLNVTCKLNNNNNISLKKLYSINTDDKTIKRSGMFELTNQENPSLLKSTAFWYTQNNVQSNQLIGEHVIPKANLKVNWNAGYTQVKRKVPNLKRTLYTRKQKLIAIIPEDPSEPAILHPSDTMYAAQIPYSGTSGPDYSGVMLSSKMKEDIKSIKIDALRDFTLSKTLSVEGKIGGFYQVRNRDYLQREFSYSKYGQAGQTVSFLDSITYLNSSQLYSTQNMGLLAPGVGGLKLSQNNDFSQAAYNANSSLLATYAMVDLKYKTWLRFVTGVRYESYQQKLSHPSKLYFYDKQFVNYDTIVNDFLPSANLILSITQKQNIRLSYSKTLNRPEFREIAPLIFYDFNTNFSLSGDPTLQRATIKNYDFRYEVYPSGGQLASVSVFYKDFTNPIELIQGENAREITYRNSPKAICKGLELEYRISLGLLTKNDTNFFGRILNNITLFSNFSYIKSKTDIVSSASANKGVKIGERQMQGQSPYIINAGITYNDKKYNYSLSASYNRFGSRIYIAGNISNLNKSGEGNIWEMGRNVLDLQATKSFFNNKFEIRFNIKDALAKKQQQLFTQDSENNLTYNSKNSAPLWVTQYRATYSLQLSYKF